MADGLNLIKFCLIHHDLLMTMRLAWKTLFSTRLERTFYRVGDAENFSAANYFFFLQCLLNYCYSTGSLGKLLDPCSLSFCIDEFSLLHEPGQEETNFPKVFAMVSFLSVTNPHLI